MKKLLLFTCCVLFTAVCIAQFTDNYWPMGRNCAINFNTIPPTINLGDSNKTCVLTQTSTSLCDRNGNLLFYCNGLKIYNRNGVIMPNGNNINVGAISNTYQGTNYYPSIKGAVSVPYPNDSNKIYLFYSNLEYTVFDYYPGKLYYSVIDRTLSGGLGDVTLKDQIAIQNDTLAKGEIMAVQHSNGKAWWILERNIWGYKYYTVLLDSAGNVNPPVIQYIGQQFVNTFKNDAAPNISLNGEKVAYITFGNDTSNIELLNFDRCSGTFSDYQLLQWYKPGVHTSTIKSCCFSPNGNLLYICDLDSLWQLDLQASNILNSAVFLGISNPFSQNFQMKNAPDGKIYIAHYGSFHNISVIEHPDVLGVGCNFLLDTIHFGSQLMGPWADGGIPNVPNLNLGAKSCNVGLDPSTTLRGTDELTIYPNPANALVQIKNTTYTALYIYNTLGTLVYEQKIKPNETTSVAVVNFPKGVYLLRATTTGGKSYTTKLVKE